METPTKGVTVTREVEGDIVRETVSAPPMLGVSIILGSTISRLKSDN
jgi:hypothetical protein